MTLAELYSTAYVDTFTLTAGHSTTVNCVCFSPDGSYLASGGDDSALIIWSITDGTLLYRLLLKSPVDCVLWHPKVSGTILVGCRSGKLFQLHDLSLISSKRNEIRIGIRGPIHCLDYDVSTMCLAIGVGHEVHITREHEQHSRSTRIAAPASNTDLRLRAVAVKFYRNGKNLIVSYMAHGILCWDLDTRSQIWAIVPPQETPNIASSALSSNGRSIIVYNLVDGVQSYDIGLFKKQTPRHHYKFDCPPRSKHCLQVAYLHQGRAVVCGTTTGNVYVWEAATGDYFQVLNHNDHTIQAVDASIQNLFCRHSVYRAAQTCQRGDANYIATASVGRGQETYVKIWRAKISRVHQEYKLRDVVTDVLHGVMSYPLFGRNEVGQGTAIFFMAVTFIFAACSSYVVSGTISWSALTKVIVGLLRRLWLAFTLLSINTCDAATRIQRAALEMQGRIQNWMFERIRSELRQFSQIPEV
ncbi:putative WD repeat-containing protein K04G11.4 [Grifola frondosa]|uniref:Putative WD repeat-containing protein K04G11.4 n=1 Tax=Grifola frondosa TaxID=5627 RepID=A0A1C7LZ51_GRIFR|nr:putative WD repeat-containing protein K04G11.4 [Grifola frondosa]